MPKFASTAVSKAEYDEDAQELELWFTGDTQPYVYHDVPDDVYFDLLDAESKGRFFADRIRDRFDHTPPAYATRATIH